MNNIIANYNPKETDIINDSYNNVIINQYINQIYIINLNTDRLREKYITIIMKKLNINYKLITVRKPRQQTYNNVIKLSKPLSKKMSIGEVGCYLSHMWCLQNIVKNNYKNGIILEDDIIVHKNFLSLFERYLSKNNEKESERIEYDFLMLGAADHGFNKGNKELIKDNIYIPKNHVIMGTHAILYSHYGAKIIYDYRLKYPVYFDKNLKELFPFFKECRTGVCYPNLFTVENSTSNMEHNFGISKYKYNEYYYNECYDNFDFQDYHFIYLDLFPKFQLEIQKLSLKNKHELIERLLMNYFNNDTELVEYHYKKLDIDYFLLEEYNEMLNVSKNPYTQLYYIGGYHPHMEYIGGLGGLPLYCKKKGITSGMLLREKTSRETIYNDIKDCSFGGGRGVSPLRETIYKCSPCGDGLPLFAKYLLDFSLQSEKISYKIEKESEIQKKYVAHLHCFNIDDFEKIYGDYKEKIGKYLNIIVTYCEGSPDSNNNECTTLIRVENRGYDIGGKFVVMEYLKMLDREKDVDMPKYILFLHSKTCEKTRAIYYDSLINNLEYIIKKAEEENDKENKVVGGFFPPTIHKGDDTPIIYNHKYLAKEVLYKCLYGEPTYNKLYLDELIRYFDLPENDITLFPSGNCYLLHIDIALKLFGEKKLYNILSCKDNINKVKCFDYNWVKTYYNIPYDEIEFVYEAYIKFGLKGNSLQVEERNRRFADGMVEHAFERIIFQCIINERMKLIILPNGKNERQIQELSEKINVCYIEKIIFKNFQWKEYLKKNMDLAKFNINTKDKVWNHWTNYGLNEGRKI